MRALVEPGVMKNLWILAVGVAVVAAPLTAATARADETVAPVIKQKIAWGETSNDLQLGVRFAAKPRTYRRGETARFDLVARNVGITKLNFNYYSPISPTPTATDESGKILPGVLKSPPPTNFPLSLKTLSLAPGEQREIEKTELRIGAPLKQTLFWALDAAPGQYRVSFRARFRFASQKENTALDLQSGFAPVEIAPLASAPTQSAEFAAQLPPGALVKEAPYTWGRENNGLQLGIRLVVPGEIIPATKPVPLGTLVMFDLAVRNLSEQPIEIRYSRDMWSQSPSVTDEVGQPLSLNAQAALFGAARGGPVSTVTKILAPREMLQFDSESLAVGVPEDKEYRDPVLAVEPGVYRVSYNYVFDLETAISSRADGLKNLVQFERDKPEQLRPNYKYDLTSGEVWLEVAPAKPAKF